MNKISRIIYMFSNFVFAKFPVKQNRVYFYNIWGKYNDSTKVLFLEMFNRHPDFEYFYEVSSKNIKLPNGLIPVKKNSLKSIYYKMTSRVVFDNDYGGIKWRGVKSRANKISWFIKSCIQKNSTNFSVGHGTFIKTVGLDRKLDNYDVYITSTDYMCVSNSHWKETTERNTFGTISKYLLTGTPRNDRLFDTYDIETLKIQNDLINKKIAIIAPTFRTEIRNGVVYHLGAEDFVNNIKKNAENLVSKLSEKFGGDWILGLRMHPGIKSSTFDRTEFLFSANEMDDITDYLLMSDLLITDYSSCAFDMAITYKPCFLLWSDEKFYRNQEQGLYFEREELPFPIADDIDGLINLIEKFDKNIYINNLNNYFKLYGMYTGNDSTARVANCVDQILGFTNHDYLSEYKML